MKTGIYLVDTQTDKTRIRSLVIARSAQEAAEGFEREGMVVEVGRLGTFDPGLDGAAVTALVAMGEAVVSELQDDGEDES